MKRLPGLAILVMSKAAFGASITVTEIRSCPPLFYPSNPGMVTRSTPPKPMRRWDLEVRQAVPGVPATGRGPMLTGIVYPQEVWRIRERVTV